MYDMAKKKNFNRKNQKEIQFNEFIWSISLSKFCIKPHVAIKNNRLRLKKNPSISCWESRDMRDQS
jgi:hypothetical protein